MLPVNQLCSWLPIMLLAINYAQNYASIIGKGLSATNQDNLHLIKFKKTTANVLDYNNMSTLVLTKHYTQDHVTIRREHKRDC